MSWETIITATVIAAFISGASILIKSYVDNNAKRNDALLLFKHTKLYDIISELQTKNETIKFDATKNSSDVDLNRDIELRMSYALAKPLLDSKCYSNFEEEFAEIAKLKREYTNNYKALTDQRKSEITISLIEKTANLEKNFEAVVHEELSRLVSK